MPPAIGRRRIEEFRRAFGGEIDSLAALYRNAAADMLDVLGDASAVLLSRQRAIAHLRQYQIILADLHDEAAAWIETNIPRAYHIGLEFADEGARNIRKAGINLGRRQREVFSQVHREAAQTIVEELLRTSDFALAQIGRRANDVFRRVGIEEVAKGIAEGKARIEVSRQIRQRLLREGRPYFADALGRQWDLDRYAEMVARTTTREAMTQGTINRLREHRILLAQVSAHNAADFCIYYENVIVSIGEEPHPTYPPISAIGGGPPFHPNCVHVLTPFVERLATNEEKRRGIISPDLLNRSPTELQRRFRKEFPGRARAAGKRELARAGRARGQGRGARAGAAITEPALRVLEPGTILRRTYKGREYVVQVVEGGKIYFEGGMYRSLTDVARIITGQRAISGPAFFHVAEVGARGGRTIAAAPSATAAIAKAKPTSPSELLFRLQDEIREKMGTQVGWNGLVRKVTGPGYAGIKDWDCGISLHSQTLAGVEKLVRQTPETWKQLSRAERQRLTRDFTTCVHEMTHAAGATGEIAPADYATRVGQWLEEAVTSAASEEIAPAMFRDIMGWDAGLDKSVFCGFPAYRERQRALAGALGGRVDQYYDPMEGVPSDVYLGLAFKVPRPDRLWAVAQEMAKHYQQLNLTAVEIEAMLEQAGQEAVFQLAGRLASVSR